MDSGAATTHSLSDRERQILRYAIEGLTDQAIAHRLEIAIPTVNTYWGRIRAKFGPYSRTELAAIYLRAESEKSLQLLRYENAKLIAELQRADVETKIIAEEYALVGQLIESAPDAILVCKGDMTVALANKAASEMFGYSQDEWPTLRIPDVIPAELRPKHLVNVKDYMSNPERKDMHGNMAVQAITKDGSSIRVVVSLNSASTKAGTYVIAIVRQSA